MVTFEGAAVVVVMSEQSGSSFRSLALDALKQFKLRCIIWVIFPTFVRLDASDFASHGVLDKEGVFTNLYEDSYCSRASYITEDLKK